MVIDNLCVVALGVPECLLKAATLTSEGNCVYGLWWIFVLFLVHPEFWFYYSFLVTSSYLQRWLVHTDAVTAYP